MTPEEVSPWHRELIASLRAVVERFNAANPEHSIQDFDEHRFALGLRVVRGTYPSCYFVLQIVWERPVVVAVECSRRRVAERARETVEKYPIISAVGEPLLVEDVNGPLTADELAERLIVLFRVE